MVGNGSESGGGQIDAVQIRGSSQNFFFSFLFSKLLLATFLALLHFCSAEHLTATDGGKSLPFLGEPFTAVNLSERVEIWPSLVTLLLLWTLWLGKDCSATAPQKMSSLLKNGSSFFEEWCGTHLESVWSG